MSQQAAALRQLQSLDSQIDSITRRLAEIDNLLGKNEAVRKAQEALDAAQKRHLKWSTRQKDLELEREQLKREADTAEARLYSGKVHNPRELTDLQDKMSELRTRREALEEPMIEAMLEVEQAEEDIAARQKDLEKATERHAAKLSDLTEERAELTEHLASLRENIQETRARIEPDHLKLYDRLRKLPRGIAVAEISNAGECAECGVGLTTAVHQRARRGEVETCPTCNRIVVGS